MNDQTFIPAGQDVAVVEKPIELQVLEMQGKAVGDPAFKNLLAVSAAYMVSFNKIKEIKTREEFEDAVRVFDGTKVALRDLKAFEDGKLAFYKVWAKTLKDMLKPIELNFNTIKEHFRGLIDKYRADEIAAAKKAQEEAEAKAKAAAEAGEPQTEKAGEETTEIVMPGEMQGPLPTALENTQRVEGTLAGEDKTVSVHQREFLEVKVADPVAFLKAVVSTNKRLEDITLDMVEIKVGKIKPLCKGKRKIPGIEWEMVKKTV